VERDFSQRSRYKERREQGLCYDCDEQPLIGYTRCPKHLLRQRVGKHKQYYNYKEQGLCYRCGDKLTIGDFLCSHCSYKSGIEKKKYYQQHQKLEREKAIRRHQSYFSEGRCYRCGAPLIEDEIKYCFACKAIEHKLGITIGRVLKYATAD